MYWWNVFILYSYPMQCDYSRLCVYISFSCSRWIRQWQKQKVYEKYHRATKAYRRNSLGRQIYKKRWRSSNFTRIFANSECASKHWLRYLYLMDPIRSIQLNSSLVLFRRFYANQSDMMRKYDPKRMQRIRAPSVLSLNIVVVGIKTH